VDLHLKGFGFWKSLNIPQWVPNICDTPKDFPKTKTRHKKINIFFIIHLFFTILVKKIFLCYANGCCSFCYVDYFLDDKILWFTYNSIVFHEHLMLSYAWKIFLNKNIIFPLDKPKMKETKLTFLNVISDFLFFILFSDMFTTVEWPFSYKIKFFVSI
jgi:hypothetical protein